MYASLSRFTVALFILLFAKGTAFSQGIKYFTTRLAVPDPISTNRVVGTIEGELSVSPSGAATYSIPIKVAPGTAGMEPKLSLVYSSQGGNGILGQGWSLSGLSAISRNGKDYYHDEKVAPINWNNNDAFYLDGSRLTVINDSIKSNGEHNAVYSTEQEVGTRVLQQWQTSYPGGSPYWFRVHNKDGMAMDYGGAGNSQVFSNNSNNSSEILSWKLNSIMDVNENRVNYDYEWLNGEHLLTSIKYTVNANAGLASYNEVKFIYKTRTDQNVSYVMGSGYSSKNLLEKIEVWNYESGAVRVRYYEMYYVFDGVQSLLQEIREAGLNGAVINETQFIYGDKDIRSTLNATPHGGINQPIEASNLMVARANITGDFDGDGFTDIVEIKRSLVLNYSPPFLYDCILEGLEFKMNDLNNNFNSKYTYPLGGQNGLNIGKVTSDRKYAPSDPSAKAARNENFQVGDFDGDGVDDLLIGIRSTYDYNTLEKVVILTNIRNITTSGSQAPTITYYTPPDNLNYISDDWNEGEETRSYIYVGDFDGDGISDFMTMLKHRGVNNNLISGWQITAPAKTSLPHFSPVAISQNLFPSNNGYPYPARTVSKAQFRAVINFDGGMKNEFMYVKDDNTCVFSFDRDVNNNWFATRIAYLGYPTKLHAISLGDFNGDGLTDVLTKRKNSSESWDIGLSIGTTFVARPINIPSQGLDRPSYCNSSDDYDPHRQNTPILTADINNDGKSDITYFSENQSNNTDRKIFTLYTKSVGSSVDFELSSIHFNTSSTNTYFNGESLLLGDFNGDGRVDIFNHSKNDIFSLSIGKDRQNNVLRKIRNGLGATQDINYLPLTTKAAGFYEYSGSGSFPLNNVKVPIWTVVQVGSGIQGGANLYNMFYTYNDLKILKDGRGMVGFNKVTAYNDYTKQSTTQFLKDFHPTYYVPQTVTSEVGYQSNGQYIPVSVSSEFRTVGTVSLSALSRYYVEGSTNISTDLRRNVTTSILTTYDSDHNPIFINSYIPNVESSTKTITYALASSTGTPIPSKPETIEEVRTRNGAAPVTINTAFSYLNGNLESKKDFVGLADEVTTTYSYHATGQPDSKTITTAAHGSRSESYGYDNNYRYVKDLTNNLGQTTHTNYNLIWGVPSSKTAFNGSTTIYHYDDFGRISYTVMPEGYGISRQLDWTSAPGSQNGPRYYEYVWDPSTHNSSKEFNVFAQEVSTSGNIGFANGQIEVSTTNTTYDVVGRKATTTTPHLQGEAFLNTEYYYDDFGRIVWTLSSNGNYGYSYTYSGGNLKTQILDPSLRKKYTITDPAGKTIESGDQTGVLNFEYDSWGNQTKTIANYLPLSTAVYNNYNRKESMKEASSGMTTYEYNGFGELITQTDAAQKTTTTDYDGLGRPTMVAFPEGTINYEYFNTAGQGEGAQLKWELKTDVNGALEQKREYEYDWLGRVSSAIYTQQPSIYRNTSYIYDTYSRVQSTLYSSGLSVDNTYNNTGLHQVLINGALVYQVNSVNGMGQPTEVWRGSNLTTRNDFHLGNLTRRHTPGIQDYNLEYDWIKGLITRRRDDVRSIKEDFEYDDADRLTKSSIYIPGTIGMVTLSQEQTYGQSAYSSGNILSKSDVGTMSYNKHAVMFTPNTAGALPQTQQDVSYLSYHRPLQITEGAQEANFIYGTDFERTIYELKENGTLKYQKQYLPDGVEIIKDALGNTTEVTYVPGADGVAAIVTSEIPAGSNIGLVRTYYPYTDHLGSVNVLVENHPNTGLSITHEQAFDPWGRRRDVWNWVVDDNAIPPASIALWLRGFTGHEHLDEFGLINMNARLYDPKLGRMLSVDNFVSVPSSAMGYNRYTYGLNNPISYIDPSGNDPITVAIIIGAAVGAYVGGSMANNSYNPTQWNYGSFKTWAYMYGGAAVGALSGYVGASVAASGIPFANTVGIGAASFTNSVGTYLYTGGRTDISLSLGAASYNFSRGQFGYLGKQGNSLMENIGYAAGALANLQDVFAWNVGTTNETRAEHKGGILHARSRGTAYESGSGCNYDISVAHGPADVYKYIGDNPLLENLDYARAWSTRLVDGNYFSSSADGWKVTIHNVNSKIMKSMSNNIQHGRSLWGSNPLKYGTTISGCYGHVGRALFSVGIPTLPFYGFTPHGLILQLWVRQAAIDASPIMTNK